MIESERYEPDVGHHHEAQNFQRTGEEPSSRAAANVPEALMASGKR